MKLTENRIEALRQSLKTAVRFSFHESTHTNNFRDIDALCDAALTEGKDAAPEGVRGDKEFQKGYEHGLKQMAVELANNKILLESAWAAIRPLKRITDLAHYAVKCDYADVACGMLEDALASTDADKERA